MKKKGKDNKARLKGRAYRLMKLYRLTEEEYERILAYQGYVCYICKRPPGKIKLSVDHCHKTGLLRGLLHHACNKGLAYFNDERARLNHADMYLGAPPAVIVLGNRYGLIGRAKFKKKMIYGSDNVA